MDRLIGATNAFNDKINLVRSQLTGKFDTIPNTAEQYKAANTAWAIIGDGNYGEGSAREHAALQPRFLGCKLVLSRSFARIHETNLKKQGVLPLVFANPADYDRIGESSRLSTLDLAELAPERPVHVRVTNQAGSFVIECTHTMSANQIGWFKAGSALNSLKVGVSDSVHPSTSGV
jgi:aconitate hydratase